MAMIWVAALLTFSVSREFVISLLTLFVAGYCQISFVAVANNRIQTLTPDHLRGRVMALYAQALIGVGPLGSTQAGALAQWLRGTWAKANRGIIAGGRVLERLVRARPAARPPGASRSASCAQRSFSRARRRAGRRRPTQAPAGATP